MMLSAHAAGIFIDMRVEVVVRRCERECSMMLSVARLSN